MTNALETVLAAQDWSLLGRLNAWTVTRDEDLVSFSLSARDGEVYRTQILCDGYPTKPPSVVFVNDAGSKLDPKAWPKGNAKFMEVVKPPQSCFLCMPLTREGLQHHGEWIGTPTAWGPGKSLLDVLNYLQRLLNSNDYEGRGG